MNDEQILELIKKAAANCDYEIFKSDLIFSSANLRIVIQIDHLDGISHEDCGKYSSELLNLIEESEFSQKFIVEVSSPGINRKLRGIEDYTRFCESPVKIIYEIKSKRDVVKGIIKKVEKGEIYLDLSGKEFILNFTNIIKAYLDY